MKKLLITALGCVALMFTSCSSDDNGGSTSTGSFSAKVDGQTWSTSSVSASLTTVDVDAEGAGTALQIFATKNDQSWFTLIIPLTDLTEGTFTFAGIDTIGSLRHVNSAMSYADSNDDGGVFNVTITDLDIENGRVSGTFSGTLVSFDDVPNVSITEGEFTNILMVTNDYYNGGTMSLSRDGGASFIMDENEDDEQYLLINQINAANRLTLIGYNSNFGPDFGTYTVTMPIDVAPGTYSLTSDEGFEAGFSVTLDNSIPFTITSGSVTVTSHNGNNLVGTFHFVASAATGSADISNGTFNITHR